MVGLQKWVFSRRKQWWVIKKFPAKKTHLKILIFGHYIYIYTCRERRRRKEEERENEQEFSGQENPLENSDFRPLYIHIYM